MINRFTFGVTEGPAVEILSEASKALNKYSDRDALAFLQKRLPLLRGAKPGKGMTAFDCSIVITNFDRWCGEIQQRMRLAA